MQADWINFRDANSCARTSDSGLFSTTKVESVIF